MRAVDAGIEVRVRPEDLLGLRVDAQHARGAAAVALEAEAQQQVLLGHGHQVAAVVDGELAHPGGAVHGRPVGGEAQRTEAGEAVGVEHEIAADAPAPAADEREGAFAALALGVGLPLGRHDGALGALHPAIAVLIVPEHAVVGVEAGQLAARLLLGDAVVGDAAADMRGITHRGHRLPALAALHEHHVARLRVVGVEEEILAGLAAGVADEPLGQGGGGVGDGEALALLLVGHPHHLGDAPRAVGLVELHFHGSHVAKRGVLVVQVGAAPRVAGVADVVADELAVAAPHGDAARIVPVFHRPHLALRVDGHGADVRHGLRLEGAADGPAALLAAGVGQLARRSVGFHLAVRPAVGQQDVAVLIHADGRRLAQTRREDGTLEHGVHFARGAAQRDGELAQADGVELALEQGVERAVGGIGHGANAVGRAALLHGGRRGVEDGDLAFAHGEGQLAAVRGHGHHLARGLAVEDVGDGQLEGPLLAVEHEGGVGAVLHAEADEHFLLDVPPGGDGVHVVLVGGEEGGAALLAPLLQAVGANADDAAAALGEGPRHDHHFARAGHAQRRRVVGAPGPAAVARCPRRRAGVVEAHLVFRAEAVLREAHDGIRAGGHQLVPVVQAVPHHLDCARVAVEPHRVVVGGKVGGEVAHAASLGVVDGQGEACGVLRDGGSDGHRAGQLRGLAGVLPRGHAALGRELGVAPGADRCPVELARGVAGLHVVGVAVDGPRLAGGVAPEELVAQAECEAGVHLRRLAVDQLPRDAHFLHVALAIGVRLVGHGGALAEVGATGPGLEQQLVLAVARVALVLPIGDVHDGQLPGGEEPGGDPEGAVGLHAHLPRVAFPAVAGIEVGVDGAEGGGGVAPLGGQAERVGGPHGGHFDGVAAADGAVGEAPDAAAPVPVVELAVDGHLARRGHHHHALVLALPADHVAGRPRGGGQVQNYT